MPVSHLPLPALTQTFSLAARQDMEKMRLQNQDILNSRNQEQQDQATARNRAAEDYDAAVLKGEQSMPSVYTAISFPASTLPLADTLWSIVPVDILTVSTLAIEAPRTA